MVIKTVDGQHGVKYWDLFEQRIDETVKCVLGKTTPPLRRLSLHITNRCNFNCVYCNEEHSRSELSPYLFKKVVDEFSELGGGVLHITGGEPSLVSYIDKGVYYAHSKGNITVNLNTNAFHRLKDSTYEKLSRLKVSLDTWSSEQFDFMVRRSGAFDKVVKNIKHISKLKSSPTISITYTVNAQNYRDIPKFLDYYYENLKVYAVFFSIYKGDNKLLEFTKQHRDELFEEIYPVVREKMRKNEDLDSLWLLDNSHTYINYRKRNRFPENKTRACYLALTELSVYENGDISHCSHLHRDGITDERYNIATHSLKDILIEKHTILDKIPLNQKCMYGCNLKLCKFNKECNNRIGAHNAVYSRPRT